jgi:hypothetical protein
MLPGAMTGSQALPQGEIPGNANGLKSPSQEGSTTQLRTNETGAPLEDKPFGSPPDTRNSSLSDVNAAPPSNWIHRLVDKIVIGSDGLASPEYQEAMMKYALICGACYRHNGLALPQEFGTMKYICRYCGILNDREALHQGRPHLLRSKPNGAKGSQDVSSALPGTKPNAHVVRTRSAPLAGKENQSDAAKKREGSKPSLSSNSLVLSTTELLSTRTTVERKSHEDLKVEPSLPSSPPSSPQEKPNEAPPLSATTSRSPGTLKSLTSPTASISPTAVEGLSPQSAAGDSPTSSARNGSIDKIDDFDLCDDPDPL